VPITDVAFIRAKAGQEAALGRLLTDLAKCSRREPGCINYVLHRSSDQPSLWFLYGKWCSERDLQAHLEASHMLRFAQASASLMQGEVTYGLFIPCRARPDTRAMRLLLQGSETRYESEWRHDRAR
jgi:quinol monooxygenase YgiN